MQLKINHITVHNNTLLYILELKEHLLKIQKLHIKQTSNLRTLNTQKLHIKQTSNLRTLNTHTHTHILLWCLNRFIYSEIILTADIDCIRFQYAKSSTRWKNLLTFSKDIAVVIHIHPNLLYHMTFIQLT